MEISSIEIIPNRPVDFTERLESEGVKPDAVSYVQSLIFDDMYYDFDPDSFEVGGYVMAVIHPHHLTNSNQELEFYMQVVNKDITYVEADDTVEVMVKIV